MGLKTEDLLQENTDTHQVFQSVCTFSVQWCLPQFPSVQRRNGSRQGLLWLRPRGFWSEPESSWKYALPYCPTGSPKRLSFPYPWSYAPCSAPAATVQVVESSKMTHEHACVHMPISKAHGGGEGWSCPIPQFEWHSIPSPVSISNMFPT